MTAEHEEHPLVRLARDTIKNYVHHGRTLELPSELLPEMCQKAGTFVSLHKGGELRGCIGTIGPTQENVAREIIQNAISAATRDPRFSPVRPDEVEDLDISVDILTEPEPVNSLDELDPKKYGVIVESRGRRGLLLPDLEGVDTVEAQVDIARRKAWIGPSDPIKLYRFRVIRYGQH